MLVPGGTRGPDTPLLYHRLMGGSEKSAGRPPLVERSVDADERARLLVLRAATEPSGPIYAAILWVLVQAKDRYQVQVKTEEIASVLAAAGFDTAAVISSLEQAAP